MILGEQTRSVDATRFAKGLVRAMRSVVRVTFGEETSIRCTGWMLTPRLVVVPNHVLIPGKSITVQSIEQGHAKWSAAAADEPEQLGVGRYSHPAAKGYSFGIALIALKRSKRVPRLEFANTEIQTGALTSVLSYPRGEAYLYLSPGTLRAKENPFITCDCDTEPGSSGAPVFDAQWCVIGVHLLADFAARTNSAINQSALMEMLQESRHWPEIAAFHGLANVATATKIFKQEPPAAPEPSGTQATLLRAALTISFLPDRLSEKERELMRDKVVDARAKSWTLQPSIRREALAAAVGGLEALRPYAARRKVSTGDRVIKRILEGPPYDLWETDEESLSWWVQAAGWFAGIVEGLPTPEQVVRELERRRMRSQFKSIAGPDFEGRKKELAKMRQWFSNPTAPFAVTGIGGVGKSALVARFASLLPAETLLLWLDFDRADLAPDDAVSVLTALSRQASVQLDNFAAPPAKPDTWQADAAEFGKALASYSLSYPPLLVMDSFEAAQYEQRYQELWPVLKEIQKHLPSLRVIVSGRAPVESLQGLVLKGLAEQDARAWLKKHGISREPVVKRVLQLTGCLPLNLHLTYHLVESGGRIRDLPRRLPPELITGFLYGRILDRVQSQELKPVSEAALALRRLTAEMVPAVLGGLVSLPSDPPEKWFGELSRECALVEGVAVLKLRPEVRAAALKLLAQAKPKLVKALDERAASWYARQDLSNPEMAAELVYHRLRLGDVKGAEAVWIDGCRALLQYEEANLSGPARRWLEERRGSVPVLTTSVEVWEQEAAERIRDVRRRGHNRAISGVFAERSERTNNSPLVFQEACQMRAAGKNAEALKYLEDAGPGQGTVRRERAVLHGLLLAESDRKYEAEVMLREVENSEWKDRPAGELERLLVLAGRLRIATDISAELEMINYLSKSTPEAFQEWVSPIDVVLPALGIKFALSKLDYVVAVKVPGPDKDGERFAEEIEKYRLRTIEAEPSQLAAQRKRVMAGEEADRNIMEQSVPAAMVRVLECGWRRWAIASSSDVFWQLFIPGERTATLADYAIAGSTALFMGFTHLSLITGTGIAEKYLRALFEKLLRTPSGILPEPQSPTAQAALKVSVRGGDVMFFGLPEVSAAVYLLAPNPLEVLLDRLSGKES